MGSYNDIYGLMTYFEKRNPWKITHSYGMYQENWWFATAMLVYKSDFFEKKKKTCHQTALTALSIGHAEPQVWQDLEKAWKKTGPAEVESIIFLR